MENEKNEMQDKENQILSEVETLVKAEYEVVRLQMVDGASRMMGALLLAICLVLMSFAVLAFGAAAAVYVLALYVPAWAACLMVGAVFLLLIPILIACSKTLFINPLVKKMSGFKNVEELKYETLRAEGRAAVQRERMSGHIRFAQAVYTHYTQLAKTAWNAILGLFTK
jgi:hypothetical protein